MWLYIIAGVWFVGFVGYMVMALLIGKVFNNDGWEVLCRAVPRAVFWWVCVLRKWLE